MNKSLLSASVVVFLGLTGSSGTLAQSPAVQVFVTEAGDSGPGSFRHAVEQANANPTISRIHFLGQVTTVPLTSTVEFTGSQDLTIAGNAVTLDGSGIALAGPAFRASGGSDLAISNLTVRDSPADGLVVEVPADATGTVSLSLFKVDVINNSGHGVLVNDQVDPSTSEGIQPNANGSAASIDVSVINSRFIRNGYSVSDRDGLRVNEGGAGDLIIMIHNSLAHNNAADGIEVDERGAGNVQVDVFNTNVTENGRFDELDLDDGFDIDEYNEGSIIGKIFQLSANDNFEEGLDFNENNAGDLRVDLLQVAAHRNGEEGIDFEEDDDFAGGGDLVAQMTHVTANANGISGDGDAGLKIREKGAGDLNVIVKDIEASSNLIGGLSVREDDIGDFAASVTGATTLANGGRGIDLDENAAGNLIATLARSTSLNNLGDDLRSDEGADGMGVLYLANVIYIAVGGNVQPTILN